MYKIVSRFAQLEKTRKQYFALGVELREFRKCCKTLSQALHLGLKVARSMFKQLAPGKGMKEPCNHEIKILSDLPPLDNDKANCFEQRF